MTNVDTHPAMKRKYERIQLAVYNAFGLRISLKEASRVYAFGGDSPSLAQARKILQGGT